MLFVDDHRNKESSTPTPPCHDVICVLLSGSLAAATIEDKDEMNPIENAIMSSASLTSIQLLQAAARNHLQATSASTCSCPGPTTMSRRKSRRVSLDSDTSCKGMEDDCLMK